MRQRSACLGQPAPQPLSDRRGLSSHRTRRVYAPMFNRDAMLSAQGLNAAKIDIVQQIDAFALSRFDDKNRDIARRQGFLQRREIVEWTCAVPVTRTPKRSLKIASPLTERAP
jgi:hypothetical protein